MCSLQEHIEREIRARKAQPPTTENEKSPTANEGGFFMPESRRRWKYVGAETHYGYRYHLWENAATKRRFAWETDAYRRETTKETV